MIVQIVTVRSTAFEAASTSGGSGTIEDTATPADLPSVSEYVGQSLTKSDRPDLASAKVTPKPFFLNTGRVKKKGVISGV